MVVTIIFIYLYYTSPRFKVICCCQILNHISESSSYISLNEWWVSMSLEAVLVMLQQHLDIHFLSINWTPLILKLTLLWITLFLSCGRSSKMHSTQCSHFIISRMTQCCINTVGVKHCELHCDLPNSLPLDKIYSLACNMTIPLPYYS